MFKKLHLSLLAVIGLVGITACGGGTKESSKSGSADVIGDGYKKISLTSDIQYRTGESKSWVLDLAQPENFATEGLRPAIVIIHGGGWSMGKKDDVVYRNLICDYALQGYVAISVGYRLTQEAPFPACIEDVKCAVRWLRAHAAELRVDPDRIGSYGHSAGAHLSLMLAVSADNKDLEGDGPYKEYSSKVTCAAAGSPPTEIGRPGTPLAEHTEWWPIGYTDAKSSPMLLIQGLDDPVVKAPLTEDFVAKSKAAGNDIEFLELPGHHGVAYDLHLEITKPTMDTFFAKYLKGIRSDSPKSQIIKQKNVDDGGSGPYKAFAVTEKSLDQDVVYRPCDLQAAAKGGKLPVMIFANGGCNNTSITHERVLNEIASHGYVIIALGPMQMDLRDRQIVPTEGSELIYALDWISAQNENPESEYYKCLDLDKVAFGGQSCGGAEILSVASDPRIKTFVMYNTGMGSMSMSSASAESLKTVGKRPMIYIIGGEPDIAYKNAKLDYENMPAETPVVFSNLVGGGHMGTFAELYGGSFSWMAIDWLDWQFKGKNKSALFEKGDLTDYPGWTLESKNF